jgi:nuclear pore complex protein Nup155
MRGLFPDIRRAWMTIDSDLYVWTYEQASDTAYYDRLTETITGVALVCLIKKNLSITNCNIKLIMLIKKLCMLPDIKYRYKYS